MTDEIKRLPLGNGKVMVIRKYGNCSNRGKYNGYFCRSAVAQKAGTAVSIGEAKCDSCDGGGKIENIIQSEYFLMFVEKIILANAQEFLLYFP